MLISKTSFNALQGILLAIIINSNIFIALQVPFANMISISSIVLLILSSINKYKSFFQKKNINNSFTLLILSFLFIAGISIILNLSFHSIGIYLKYLIIFLICFISSRQSLASIKIFLTTTVLLNIIFSIVSISDIKFILSNENTNYLNATYTLGMSFIIIFISTYRNFSLIKLFIALLFLYTMLLFPSRGTILFSVIVCFLFIYKHKPKGSKIKKLVFIGFLIGLYFLAYWVINVYLENSYLVYRFMNLIQNIHEEPRVSLYIQAFNGIMENPILGLGIGNAGLALGDLKIYPHNIFIEVYMELGILGFIIFSLILVKLFKIASKSYVIHEMGLILFYVFLYSFLTFQKSFSLKYGQFLLIPICLSVAIYNYNLKFKK